MNTKPNYTIIPNYDPASLWISHFQRAAANNADGATYVSLLEQMIDAHADAEIDWLVHSVFEGFRTPYTSCENADPYSFGDHPILRGHSWIYPVLDAIDAEGRSLIQVLLDRCQKKHVKFLVGLRMNDRHAGSGQNALFWPRVQRMLDEHPEWALTEFPGGLDYRYEGVRQAVLAFVAETLERFDVDGLEFDWMRWCHMFPASEAVSSAPLLTEFTRKVREMLDQASSARGRTDNQRLVLGARVPHTLEQCIYLGYDIEAWLKDGLVDYLAPSDFFFMDYNMPTEDFVSLADEAGSRCRIYPSLHPGCCWDNNLHNTAANYRAAAKNFYAQGAHGVSPYNYQSHWGLTHRGGVEVSEDIRNADHRSIAEFEEPLNHLTQLRRDDTIASGDRHYCYYPLWWDGASEGHAASGAYENDRLFLDCRDADPQGSYAFTITEDLSDPNLTATLAFIATQMIEADQLQIHVNGHAIDPNQIEREWFVGRARSEGRPLGRHFIYRMPLTSPSVQSGENELAVRLSHLGGMPSRVINVQDFEIYVHVGP